MVTKDPFSDIAMYYSALVDRYGHDTRACDYHNPASQIRKFEVLAEVIGPTDRRILDVGCGFADFWPFLRSRWPDLVYEGIDLSPRMIAEARRNHPDVALRVANVLDLEETDEYDLVFANGIFYLLGDEAPALMSQIVQKLFALSRRATAFNTLSTWTPDPEPGEFYADPVETLQMCSELTHDVVLRHDYHPRDFTMYLYRRTDV